MVNIVDLLDRRLLPPLMRLAGVRPELIQLEPATTMKFWVPTRKPDNSKPALVLLHGFAANAILTWQFQVLALAKAYDVYIPEFIFFGESITGRPERSPEFQAECVAMGLRKMGVGKCVVVGFSYGTMVGFKLAEMYPSMVVAMVATAGTAALTESVSRGSLEKIGFGSWPEYLVPATAEGVRTLLRIGSCKLPPFPHWCFRHYFEAMVIHRMERAQLLDALVVADDENMTPITDRCPQRIHIIWGKCDQIFDLQIANSFKEQFGGKATMDVIENAGHIVNLERPCVYNKCLKKFLHSLFQHQNN